MRRSVLIRRASATVVALAATACLELPRPRDAAVLDPRDVVAPKLTLESGCVASGVERCFDALDDNCNGIIDEGCGLETGVLQFVIAWSEPVDVDLRVTGPDGALAALGEATSVGLVKDRDCKGTSDCHGQNVENVYLADGWPRRGRYRVAIRLEDAREVPLPIRVRLSVRVGQKTVTALAVLEERRGEQTYEFSL